jgi:hypothetical protein
MRDHLSNGHHGPVRMLVYWHVSAMAHILNLRDLHYPLHCLHHWYLSALLLWLLNHLVMVVVMGVVLVVVWCALDNSVLTCIRTRNRLTTTCVLHDVIYANVTT